jgi:hypothetical protein
VEVARAVQVLVRPGARGAKRQRGDPVGTAVGISCNRWPVDDKGSCGSLPAQGSLAAGATVLLGWIAHARSTGEAGNGAEATALALTQPASGHSPTFVA